jgi:hypothetical protein
MPNRQNPGVDPEARDKIRRSLPWIAAAIIGLVICLAVLPQGIGQLGALIVGVVSIISIRRVWRS